MKKRKEKGEKVTKKMVRGVGREKIVLCKNIGLY
jgi:hypothetical protein